MEATTRVVSRSSKLVSQLLDKPVPATVQVVIQAGRVSITKHLRYEAGQYVGRAYDYRKRQFVPIAFPLGILMSSFTETVEPKLAASLAA